VPRARTQRRRDRADQGELAYGDEASLSSDETEYNTTPIINEIREHAFQGFRPFFRQREAVATIIWLTEVAPKASTRGERYRDRDSDRHVRRMKAERR